MDLSQLIDDPLTRRNLVASLALLAVAIGARWVAVRTVRRIEWSSDAERLSWLARIRLIVGLLVIGGLIFVWAEEIRTLALSAVAVAAAIVIATKELIMCVSGGFVRRAGQIGLGDRIEVSGHRGDVVDQSVWTTTILEIGPGQQRTGRAIVLPNAVFLSQPVVNESFTERFVLHVVTVGLSAEADWRAARDALREAAFEVTAPHLGEARAHMQAMATRHGLSTPSVEPRVFLRLPEPNHKELLLRFPAPSQEKARMEQRILESYLDRVEPGGQTTPEATDTEA